MALTMTRNRTQTTLTKLAKMVANVHGELEFVAGLLEEAEAADAAADAASPRAKASTKKLTPEQSAALQARKGVLEERRQALYLTLRQFDPGTDARTIGPSQDCLKPWARGARHSLGERYVASLLASLSR